MKEKILVTRKIPESGLNLLKKKYEVEINPENRVMKKEELLAYIKDKQALLCLLTDTIDAEVMEAAPDLKVISNYAVGFNNINIQEATKRGIFVTNTPGVLTDSTADLAFSLLMAVARRIPEADLFTREGKFKGWDPLLFLGQDIYDKTLGIIGFGRIGQRMAERGKGFNMKVLYYSRSRVSPEVENLLNAQFVGLDELLKKSDFVSLHVPLSEATHHLLGERELGLMKETACLINTSRGPVVDEKALIRVLKNKEIFGAGLDVFEEEPFVPEALRQLNNTVLLPHIGSASLSTRSKMSQIAAQNIINVLQGEKPVSLVNEEVG